jgi:hypothetical protein
MNSSRIQVNIMALAGAATLLAGLTLAPAAARASISPQYTCPTGDVCFYSGTNFTGTPYPVKISGKGGSIINLRNQGVAVPWASVSNRDGGLTVNIYNMQCECNGFGLPSGQREANPGAPYTSDGYMHVE